MTTSVARCDAFPLLRAIARSTGHPLRGVVAVEVTSLRGLLRPHPRHADRSADGFTPAAGTPDTFCRQLMSDLALEERVGRWCGGPSPDFLLDDSRGSSLWKSTDPTQPTSSVASEGGPPTPVAKRGVGELSPRCLPSPMPFAARLIGLVRVERSAFATVLRPSPRTALDRTMFGSGSTPPRASRSSLSFE